MKIPKRLMVLSEFQNYDTKIIGVSIILSNSCMNIYINIYVKFTLYTYVYIYNIIYIYYTRRTIYIFGGSY